MSRSSFCNFVDVIYEKPVFTAKGLGVASCYNNPLDYNLKQIYKYIDDFSGYNKEELYEIINSDVRSFQNKIKNNGKYPDKFLSRLVLSIGGRDSKKILYSFFKNNIIIAPLSDPVLWMLNPYINDDPIFLKTLILTRYFPDLLQFEIEGHRTFKQTSLEISNHINQLYPLATNHYNHLSNNTNIIHSYDYCKINDLINCVTNRINSDLILQNNIIGDNKLFNIGFKNNKQLSSFGAICEFQKIVRE